MDPLVRLLRKNCELSHKELAAALDTTEEEIARRIDQLERDEVILGYQAVVDWEKADTDSVVACIEVKIAPERGGGFDRLASRIARFEQVMACYLMSGGYDLLVIVEGDDLRDVSRFISEKLSTINGVLSTASHFRLKVYKENGAILAPQPDSERLPVSP